MDIEEQRHFFNREVSEWKLSDYISEFKNPTLASKYQQKIFHNFLSPKRGENILELGGGFGQWTLPLLALGVNVTVVDISEKSLEICNKLYNTLKTTNGKQWGRLRIIITDVNSLNFNESFDKVFCVNLLHHISDPERTVKRMASFVKFNGFVVCLEPNPFTPLWYIYFKLFKNCWEIEKGIKKTGMKHIYRYFRKAGLSKIRVERFGIIPLRLLNFSSFLQSLNFRSGQFFPFYMFHIFRGIKLEITSF